MRVSGYHLAFFLTTFVLAGPGTAVAAGSAVAAETPANPAALEGLDELVNRSLDEWDVSGVAISIVVDGNLVHSKGYGARNARTNAPMQSDTLFPIASLAKAFTAVGVGTLVDDDVMSFDAPVRKYIPGFELIEPTATHEVTIRDLLSHRSGLAGSNDFVYYRNPAMSREELVRRARYFKLQALPREKYEYSNAGYVIIGHAMENAAAKLYEQIIEDRVFRPLGMTRTTFSDTKTLADPNHALGRWYWRGRPIDEHYQGGSIINPHGGTNSTAADMAKWMIFNLSGGTYGGRQILQPGTLQEIQQTQIPASLASGNQRVSIGYGLGWDTLVYRGEMTLLHTGGLPGIRTITILVPDRKIGVTVLTNGEAPLFYYLAFHIVDRLLGEKQQNWLTSDRLEKWRAAQKDAKIPAAEPGEAPLTRPLTDFTGTYTHPGFGTLRISVEGGRLLAEYNGHRAALVHRHHSVFQPVPQPASVLEGRIQFLSNLDGNVEALVFEPFGSARFEKGHKEPKR